MSVWIWFRCLDCSSEIRRVAQTKVCPRCRGKLERINNPELYPPAGSKEWLIRRAEIAAFRSE